jgi:predicted alpha/beta-hydrolase family hydrolase
MRPWIAGLAGLGYEARYVPLPKGKAERALPVYREAAPTGDDVVIGGQSFGGRVASLIAQDGGYGGLILLCYPLHRPGHPDTAAERTAHWPRISCPVLLLSGESDPFARVELLREAVGQLPSATLATYPGIGHGLDRVREDALSRIAEWLARIRQP